MALADGDDADGVDALGDEVLMTWARGSKRRFRRAPARRSRGVGRAISQHAGFHAYRTRGWWQSWGRRRSWLPSSASRWSCPCWCWSAVSPGQARGRRGVSGDEGCGCEVASLDSPARMVNVGVGCVRRRCGCGRGRVSLLAARCQRACACVPGFVVGASRAYPKPYACHCLSYERNWSRLGQGIERLLTKAVCRKAPVRHERFGV